MTRTIKTNKTAGIDILYLIRFKIGKYLKELRFTSAFHLFLKMKLVHQRNEGINLYSLEKRLTSFIATSKLSARQIKMLTTLANGFFLQGRLTNLQNDRRTNL